MEAYRIPASINGFINALFVMLASAATYPQRLWATLVLNQIVDWLSVMLSDAQLNHALHLLAGIRRGLRRPPEGCQFPMGTVNAPSIDWNYYAYFKFYSGTASIRPSRLAF